MNVFVFVGPTLSKEDVGRELDAICLPPVAQGDVYRAAKERPFAIGIIDGYFERIPAVWHKEILWALSQGIHVFGGASMGALRAAELERFGMKGVGRVYEWFRSGELEDDDEVAVVHGDADTGYRTLSEAMVNVRATLARAQDTKVLTVEVRHHLEATAKAIFYPERCYPEIVARAAKAGAPQAQLDAFVAFLAANRIDQKRDDALALLRTLRDCCAKGEPPKPATFAFQHTEAWDQVVDWAETQPPLCCPGGGVPVDLVAAEVRLAGDEGRAVIANGFNRAVAGILGRRQKIKTDQESLAKIDRSVRRKIDTEVNGAAAEVFQQWLTRHDLTRSTYGDLLERQAHFNWLRTRYRNELNRCVADELRHTGDYARIAGRAEEKARLLERHGLAAPSLNDAGLTQSDLFAWYFEKRLNARIPQEIDEFLIEAGFADTAALEQEALRELLFTRLVREGCQHGDDERDLQRSNPSR
jgi:hypothetical protein